MSKNNPKKQAQNTSELAASSCRNQSNPHLPSLLPPAADQAQPPEDHGDDNDDDIVNLPTSPLGEQIKTDSPAADETAPLGVNLDQGHSKPIAILQQQPSVEHKNLMTKLSPAKNEKFDQQLSIDLINPNNIAVSLDQFSVHQLSDC